ncbi:MAG TPA: hypothetical protein VER36_00755 [Flavisolibacter sp.]|nr:hypothetical protein [Flavisolibacter sp.]
MKQTLHTIFTTLIFLVLGGKILSLILNFSDETDRILNTVMFTLIGIAYIVMGYVWDYRLLKIIITSCGLFLIGMNFFGNNVTLSIIGIFCVLIPMLIARFDKKGTIANKRDRN